MAEHKHASDTYDVAVVGYGPTGATLANLLAICGLNVLMLERESSFYHLPRAVHFDDEVMRVFQTVGIADALEHKIRVNVGMRFVDLDGNLLMDWPRPQQLGPQGWHASYRMHQPDLEQLLRQALEARPNAHVRTLAHVERLQDGPNHVDIEYRDQSTGDTQTAKATYVVGCDGARSMVRQFIGGDMEDLGFQERWLVVDLLLKRDMPELGDHSIQYCNADRPMTYCRSPANRRRWELRAHDHETDAELTAPGHVWELLSPWITPDDAKLERSAVYTFRSTIACQWRRARLFLAGDAAHLTPPFMGQGLCAGIRDASNLAWKLALCIRNRSTSSLLDSYQDERIPHVRDYISTAVRLGRLINALDRESALAMAENASGDTAKMASISPKIGSSLFANFGAPESAEHGCLAGQPRLSEGTLMDDACGYRPVLVLRQRLLPPPTDTPENGPVILIADDDPALTALLNEWDANALLIRPDRYILGTARTEEEIRSLTSLKISSPIESDPSRTQTNCMRPVQIDPFLNRRISPVKDKPPDQGR